MSATMTDKKIPCLDLKGQHQQIKHEIFKAFERVYEKTAFTGGPFVEEFEKAFAEYDPWIIWFGTDPKLKSLRDDQRFIDLFRRTGNPMADKLSASR